MPMMIKAPPSNWKPGTVLLVHSVAPPRQKSRVIERAGRGYQVLIDGDDYLDIELEEQKREEERLKRRAANRKKLVLPKHANLEDKYALLGLSDTHVLSTEDQIRSAYLRVSLSYHPDKAPPEQREEAETLYKAMQDAYDTLIDPDRRRVYDSTREFDDTIPGEAEGTENDNAFFELYGPVFRRNSWFSKRKPIPKLGDMDTPDDDVHKFYDFWLSFQSWREFNHKDEHKLEDAECREEKRWMERENKKLVAEQVKKEKKRIRKMVKNAMKIDPRLLRIKRRVREAKEAKKKAKMEAREKREAERKAAEDAERAEEERVAKEAADKAAQEKKEKEALRKIRKKFRQLCKKQYGFSKFDVDTLVERIDPKDLATLYAKLEPLDIEEGKETIKSQLAKIEIEKKQMEEARQKEREEKIAKERLEAALAEEEEKKRAVWADIELMWLAKAVQKFPSGSHNRWIQIRDMVNLMAKNPPDKERTEKDVIKQVRVMNQRKLQTGFSTAYTKKFKMDSGNTVFDAQPKKREAPSPGETSTASEKKSSEEIEKKKKKKKKRSKKKSKGKEEEASDKGKPKAGTPGPPETSAAEETSEWSAIQQQALEQALRTTPKGPERWDQIADKVPGKTKKECVRRFKDIRAKIMAQRATKN